MTTGRGLRAIGAALAVSAALAACGGGGGGGGKPSTLDPANMVPGSSVAYAEVAIKPQGSMRSDLIEAIDSIAGSGSAQRLDGKLDRSGRRTWRRVQSWLGERAAVALTRLPAQMTNARTIDSDVLLVLPTNDPGAARRFLAKNVKQSWAAWKVVGHYAIVGGKPAVARAAATTAKTSLASDPGFRSDMTQLGSGALFTAFAPLHQLYEQLLPLLEKLPQYAGASGISGGARQAPPGSSIALGLSALRNQFRMDLVERGVPHTKTHVSGVASDVSSLPASSWLAVTLGGALTKAGVVSKIAASVSRSIGALQAAQGISGQSIPNGQLNFIVKDLIPALGPAELSVSGSSRTTLQAGLVMAPVNRGAGARLATAVKRLVAGLPVSATTIGGRVAVTFGFSNLQQLLDPSSKLADNPAFRRALAQLPAGSRAQVYLSFSGVATLAALDPSIANSSGIRILRRLDYLIAGGTGTHFRLVLATH